MNILITGTTGFLGKEFVNQLSNFKIFKLNRKVGDYVFDLSNTIPSFQNSFDLVIHNAGKAHCTPKTNKQKNEFFRVNVVGTKNLLKALEACSPKRFVFISSVAVYGLDEGELIAENCNLCANDSYGKSKIQAEKTVQKWCKQNNVICTIFRLPLLVGSNPPGNLRAMINGIKKGYYFNISGGKAKKSMVLAEDVAKFVLKGSEIGGVYNLSDGHHPTLFELSKCISIQLKKPTPLNLNFWGAKFLSFFGDFLGSKAIINSDKLNKITSDLTFDDTKARIAFGWDPTPVLEGFKITLEN